MSSSSEEVVRTTRVPRADHQPPAGSVATRMRGRLALQQEADQEEDHAQDEQEILAEVEVAPNAVVAPGENSAATAEVAVAYGEEGEAVVLPDAEQAPAHIIVDDVEVEVAQHEGAAAKIEGAGAAAGNSCFTA